MRRLCLNELQSFRATTLILQSTVMGPVQALWQKYKKNPYLSRLFRRIIRYVKFMLGIGVLA